MTDDDLRAWCHAEMQALGDSLNAVAPSSVLKEYDRGRAVLALLDGRDEERRRAVAWLRERGMTAGAASIEDGDHWGDE